MYTLENIVGNYGISISANNYVVVRKTLFTSKTEGVEPYFKEMPFGYYGTLDQALIGLRKFYLKDEKELGDKEVNVDNIDTYISKIQKIDDDIKNFFKNIAPDIVDKFDLKKSSESSEEHMSDINFDETQIWK